VYFVEEFYGVLSKKGHENCRLLFESMHVSISVRPPLTEDDLFGGEMHTAQQMSFSLVMVYYSDLADQLSP
jgi:hypothetical protein